MDHLSPPSLRQPVAAPAGFGAGANAGTGQGRGPGFPPGPYKYIPPSVSAGIPRSWVPAANPRQWQWIVVHHSDTKTGSAAIFDRYHREVHHWNSLGYDFVIGNGTDWATGWWKLGRGGPTSRNGAHAGVLRYNEYGIGVCLVGDFQTGRPTRAQMDSLSRLCAYLMKTYRIPASRIIGHRDCKGKHTNCPGKNMDMAALRIMAARVAANSPVAGPTYAQSGGRSR